MKDQQNTIMFNGKLYDVITGKVIGDHASSYEPAKSTHQPVKHIAVVEPAEPSPPKHLANRHLHDRTVHHPHNIRRITQHSRTLMRRSVKRPQDIKHRVSDLHSSEPAAHHIDIATKLEAAPTRQHNRQKHAESVHKSQLIQRFASTDAAEPSVIKQVTHLSVKPVPHEPAVHEHTPAPLEEPSTTDLFSKALAGANSHKQTLTKHSKHQRAAKKLGVGVRSVRFGTTVLIVIILGSFIAYQNVASIRVQLAGINSGVAASLPGYRPSGFALDRQILSYKGELVLSFQSTTDNRNFKITQASLAKTNQSNNAAAQIAQQNQPYQTDELGDGTAIYLYGNNDASWVRGGTWYTIDGGSGLTSTQVLKMADSF